MDYATSTAGIDMKVEPRSILRSGRPLAPCPSPELLSRKASRLFAEAEALTERERALRAEAYDLRQSIDGVVRAEQDANAVAARNGKDFAPSTMPGIETAAAAKDAEADALAQASRAALSEALAAIAEDAEPTNERADAEVAKHLAATLEAAESCEAALADLDRAFVARRWCASVARDEIPPRSRVEYSTSLRKPSGAPYTARELLGVVRSTVAEMVEQHGYDADNGSA
jgi:hypothetical protein